MHTMRHKTEPGIKTRSLRAHEQVGFEPIHRYQDGDGADEWVIVAWDWSMNAA